MAHIAMETRPATTYAALALNVSFGNMALRITEALDALSNYLSGHGIEPAGPSIIRYRTKHSERPFQIEVGYVVEQGAWVEAPYVLDTIPAGVYVTARHEGPYWGLHELEKQMIAWARAEGHELAVEVRRTGDVWASNVEYHVGGRRERANGPEGPVEICLLVKEGA